MKLRPTSNGDCPMVADEAHENELSRRVAASLRIARSEQSKMVAGRKVTSGLRLCIITFQDIGKRKPPEPEAAGVQKRGAKPGRVKPRIR